jgi:hypothetical protein
MSSAGDPAYSFNYSWERTFPLTTHPLKHGTDPLITTEMASLVAQIQL